MVCDWRNTRRRWTIYLFRSMSLFSFFFLKSTHRSKHRKNFQDLCTFLKLELPLLQSYSPCRLRSAGFSEHLHPHDKAPKNCHLRFTANRGSAGPHGLPTGHGASTPTTCISWLKRVREAAQSAHRSPSKNTCGARASRYFRAGSQRNPAA